MDCSMSKRSVRRSAMAHKTVTSILAVLFICLGGPGKATEQVRDFSPRPQEQQLPRAMHSEMAELPRITVGRTNADLMGDTNRALQAAVDYVAALGGGVVEIGAGEYTMHDSLHLRPYVTVRGVKGQTILRKANGAVSALALDGDFGERQGPAGGPGGVA